MRRARHLVRLGPSRQERLHCVVDQRRILKAIVCRDSHDGLSLGIHLGRPVEAAQHVVLTATFHADRVAVVYDHRRENVVRLAIGNRHADFVNQFGGDHPIDHVLNHRRALDLLEHLAR